MTDEELMKEARHKNINLIAIERLRKFDEWEDIKKKIDMLKLDIK